MTAAAAAVATHPECGFLVVGDLLVDIVSDIPHLPARGTDTPSLTRLTGGGSGANVTAWIASLGHSTTLIARVGDDTLGRDAVTALASAGVSTRVTIDSTCATGTCIVLVTPDGERTMIPDAGASASLSVVDIPESIVASARHLHLSGYSLLHPGSRAAALAAIALARRHGIPLSVDASSAAPLTDAGPAAFLDWITPCDVLFANLDEARVLTGSSDPRQAAQSLAAHCTVAIVKCGADGVSVATSADQVVQHPAVPTNVVDSTGAGDAFTAGFLTSWSSHADLTRALDDATIVAARAVARVGGRP